MSHVSVVPDSMMAAGADLRNIASALDEAHRAAAPGTVALRPAASDEVSAGITHLFSQHAQDFQEAAREAAAFHEQFVGKLIASSSAYASAEDAIASLLQAPVVGAADSTTAWSNLTVLATQWPALFLLFAVIPLLWPLIPFLPFLLSVQVVELLFEALTGIPFPVVGPPIG